MNLILCFVLVVFCDYISSGRSLQFIEEYILREVLPTYGNTNSTTNITSLQSTLFRYVQFFSIFILFIVTLRTIFNKASDYYVE